MCTHIELAIIELVALAGSRLGYVLRCAKCGRRSWGVAGLGCGPLRSVGNKSAALAPAPVRVRPRVRVWVRVPALALLALAGAPAYVARGGFGWCLELGSGTVRSKGETNGCVVVGVAAARPVPCGLCGMIVIDLHQWCNSWFLQTVSYADRCSNGINQES